MILRYFLGISRFSIIRQLVELNASQNLVKLLVQQSTRETHISDPLLHELIWIAGQLSLKGKLSARIVILIRQYYLCTSVDGQFFSECRN